ncbi:MAG: endonuclease/exonuclease/phosphatase family protein [Actinobacteria bacterium]|nr:endonuclease/exonuclease/phosphatase family protein [Actinomycetota bacterium]
MALGVFLILDVLRVWLPSMILRWGETSHVTLRLGLLGVAWIAGGLLAAGALRKADSRTVALVGAAGVAVARAILQGTHGDAPQLYASSLAMTAAVVWLVGMAASPVAGGPVAAGVSTGVAASVIVHVSMRTVDLTWYTGFGPWLLVVLVGVGLVAASRRATDRGGREVAAPGLWFAVGPALVVAGLVSGAPARADAATQWDAYQPAFVVLVASCLAVLVCARARRWTRTPFAPVAVLLALVAGATLPTTTSNGVTGLLPAWAVWSQAGAALALAATLGWAGEGERATTPNRRAVAAGAGMVALVVLIFGHGAATGPARAGWLLAGGLLVGLGGLLGAGSAHTWSALRSRPGGGWRVVPVGMAATFLALIGSLAAVAANREPITNRSSATYPIRLVTYNVRAGYDLHGRFNPSDVGRAIAALHPSVVVLNEVDRGSLTSGGHDLLQLLAESLRMPFIYAPGADEVRGNAVLARFPVVSTRTERVSEPGDPSTATALSVVFRLDTGTELGLVATQLQPGATGAVEVGVAERLGQIATRLRAKNRPVVMAGDLGIEPGSAAYRSLASDFTDALAAVRPLPTYPSDLPRHQVDHILITHDLRAADPLALPATNSDHRPVGVTLSLAG